MVTLWLPEAQPLVCIGTPWLCRLEFGQVAGVEVGTTEEGVAPLEHQGSRRPKHGVVVGLCLKWKPIYVDKGIWSLLDV